VLTQTRAQMSQINRRRRSDPATAF
jgi:hypothetical protein